MDSLKPPDEHISKHLSYQVDSARGLIQICLRCPSDERAANIREYLVSTPEERRLMLATSEMVQVWKPRAGQDAWQVLWNGPLMMTRAQYCLQLQSRLRELIAANPRDAKDILTGSPESNPDLYQIALYNNPKDWAALVIECDQMRIFLNQIEWTEPGEIQRLAKNDLPSLGDICATIPS
jgi:hypothetical protein